MFLMFLKMKQPLKHKIYSKEILSRDILKILTLFWGVKKNKTWQKYIQCKIQSNSKQLWSLKSNIQWLEIKPFLGNITHLGTRPMSVTFTNSRPVAAHRRKREVTKMNEGGCRGGRVSGEVGWTSLSINKLHFWIGGHSAEPLGSASSRYLSDCWGKKRWLGPAFW